MKTNKATRFSSKTTGLLNFSDLKKLRFKVLYWVMVLILLVVALVCVLPVLWIAVSGFKDINEMYSIPPTIIPKSFHPEIVKNVWNKVHIFNYFKNSIILIIGCWTCDIVVNGLAGYVLSRLKPMGSRVIETLVFWSMLLPGISMVPLYMTFVDVPLIHVNMMGSYAPI